MKIFRKKQKSEGRSPQTPARSTPIIRYHRPAEQSNQQKAASVRVKEASKERSERKFFKVLTVGFRFSGTLAILLIVLANTTVSSVSLKVSGDRESYQSLSTYSEEINKMLRRSLVSSNKFLLNSTKLEADIESRFPEIVESSVVIPLAGRQLQVNIEFAKPMMRLLQLDNQQGIVTENGTLTLIADAEVINEQFAGLPSLSLPSVKNVQGSQLLTSDETNLLSLLLAEFDGSSEFRPRLDGVEYVIATREMRARFDSTPYYVKLTPERDARLQIGSLVAIQKELVEKGPMPKEYIDVRVDDRVYVK